MARDLSPILPEKVSVQFSARACGGTTSPDMGFPKVYQKAINLADITFGDPTITPQPKGVKDTVFVIRDTALALYSAPAGPPTNQAALDDLAKQLATDFYNFRSIEFRKVYNGIIPIPPNGLIDLMEFDYSATEQSTRISSQPWGGEATEQQHQDGSISACHDFDRTPGIHIDIPGGTTNQSMQGVLSLEDGRLVMTYDTTATLTCGCGPFCAVICPEVKSSCSPFPGIDGATITVTSKGIASIAVTNGGSGYTLTPTVTISSTNGRGGSAFALLTATTVNTASVTSNGIGYSSIPTITVTTPAGQTGSGAAASALMGIDVVGGVAVGTGYTVNDLLTVSGGTSTSAVVLKVTAIDGLGGVIAVSVNTAGSYSVLPANPVAVTGGTGNGATFNLTWKVVSIAVTAAGSGYSGQPTLAFSGGGGSFAAGTAALTATTVASVVVTAAGVYHTAPGITFSGGGGGASGAAATATLTSPTTVGTCTTNGQVTSASVSAAGSGYTSIPTATPSGGGGSGAAFAVSMGVNAAAVTNGGTGYSVGNLLTVVGGTSTTAAKLTVSAVAGGVITAVTVNTAGVYTSLPTSPVSVTGGAGAGATFTLTWKVVAPLTVTSGGSNYTSAPTVAFSGGGGSGAAGTTALRHQCCIAVPVVGGYGFSASKTGWVTNSGTVVLGSCVDNTTSIQLTPAIATLTVTVNGCNGLPLSGATVTVKQSGTTVDSGTTNGSGVYTWANAANGVSYTISVTGIAAAFASPSDQGIAINTCVANSKTFNLTPATGYHCLFSDCVVPAPGTLNLADSVYGNFTLTFGNYNNVPFGTQTGWGINTTVNFPGCLGGCPSQINVPVQYLLFANGTFQILYAGDITAGVCCPIIDQVNCANGITHTGHVCPPSLLATWSVFVPPQRLYCSGGTMTVTQ